MSDTDTISIEESLRTGQPVIYGTRGGSMRPLLRQGRTKIGIVPLDRPLRVGDLPLVKLEDGRFRLHRLVEISDRGMFTRGDNTIPLEKINPQDILGRVTQIYRGDKVITEDSPGYQRYVRFWLWSTPVRLVIFRIRAWLLRFWQRLYRFLKHKIFGRNKKKSKKD